MEMEPLRVHIRKFRHSVENIKLDGFYNASLIQKPVEFIRAKADLMKTPEATADFAAAFEADLKSIAARPKPSRGVFTPHRWVEHLERILEGY